MWGTKFPGFKSYYEAIAHKLWFLNNVRCYDRIDSPDINLQNNQQSVIKLSKWSGTRKGYSTNGAGKLYNHMQKYPAGTVSHTIYKINSKRIKDLNID